MGKRQDMNEVAYHEAGHAVIAWVLGRRFKYVTIIPELEDGSLGHVMYGNLSKNFNPEIDEYDKTRRILEKEILLSFAGVLAGKKFKGRHNFVGARSDRDIAFDYAIRICNSNIEETKKYVDWLWVRCRNMVDSNWEDIQTVARALMENKRLTYKEVGKVIRDSWDAKYGKLTFEKLTG
jgi:ATP-dependent Zn protease